MIANTAGIFYFINPSSDLRVCSYHETVPSHISEFQRRTSEKSFREENG